MRGRVVVFADDAVPRVWVQVHPVSRSGHASACKWLKRSRFLALHAVLSGFRWRVEKETETRIRHANESLGCSEERKMRTTGNERCEMKNGRERLPSRSDERGD